MKLFITKYKFMKTTGLYISIMIETIISPRSVKAKYVCLAKKNMWMGVYVCDFFFPPLLSGRNNSQILTGKLG
jgi:hypothetical protein